MNDAEIATLIPIVAIVFGIGLVAVGLVTEYRRKLRELDYRHLERMAAIEKGLDPPPEPVKPVKSMRREWFLLHGLTWLGVGLATALALPALVGDRVAQLGWVAAAVGAAFLVFYMAEGIKKPKQPPDASGADANREP